MSLSLPAFACEMATAKRASVLADYAENGQACLTNAPDTFRYDAEIERSFINKINQERSKRGLNTLKTRATMRPAARYHSLDMGFNGFFGHKTPRGKGHVFRLAAFDRTLLTAGSAENVAQFGPAQCLNGAGITISCRDAPGFKFPTRSLVTNDLHTKLMQSEGHRRNILDPEMTHIAVGVARTDTGFYVTQVFAKQAGELSKPIPLRIAAGERLNITATVQGWSVSNLAISRDASPDNLENSTLPQGLRGDVNLRVRAENIVNKIQNGSGTRIVEWIYPTGPAFTVMSPTGS